MNSRQVLLSLKLNAYYSRLYSMVHKSQVLFLIFGGGLASLLMLFSLSSSTYDDKLSQDLFKVDVLTVANNDWSIKEVLSSSTDLFINNQAKYVNLGNENVKWLKLTLMSSSTPIATKNNDAAPSADNLILLLQKNRIHTPVELHYFTHDKGWLKQLIYPNAQFRQNIVTNLPKSMANKVFYLKLQGRYLRASLDVFTNQAFLENLQQFSLYSGLFFGMLVLFILYNAMLFIRLKQSSYLAYSVMLFLLGTWFFSGLGWLEYLFPSMTYLHNKTVVIGMLVVISIAEFAKHYLGIKSLSKTLTNRLTVAQWILSAFVIVRSSVANFLPEQFSQFAYGLGLLLCLFIFTCCFWGAILGIKKQQSAAWYYLIATLMFFVVAIIMGLSAGNIINFHFSWPMLQVASIIEVLIFSAGLVSIYYQQQLKEEIIEQQLQHAQQRLVRQLELSNELKDKVLNNVIDHKLFPELAKVTSILADIVFVQALGNECLVVYKKNNRKVKIELNCNLQNLLESFGDEYLIRIHKSYLVNPQQTMLLQRRSSADYDLNVADNFIPVGRKFLAKAKTLL